MNIIKTKRNIRSKANSNDLLKYAVNNSCKVYVHIERPMATTSATTTMNNLMVTMNEYIVDTITSSLRQLRNNLRLCPIEHQNHIYSKIIQEFDYCMSEFRPLRQPISNTNVTNVANTISGPLSIVLENIDTSRGKLSTGSVDMDVSPRADTGVAADTNQ